MGIHLNRSSMGHTSGSFQHGAQPPQQRPIALIVTLRRRALGGTLLFSQGIAPFSPDSASVPLTESDIVQSIARPIGGRSAIPGKRNLTTQQDGVTGMEKSK